MSLPVTEQEPDLGWALPTISSHCSLMSTNFSPLAARRGKNRTLDTAKPALLQLSEHLLTHYNKGVRPVRDWRTTTNVAIDVMVYAILNVVSALLPQQV